MVVNMDFKHYFFLHFQHKDSKNTSLQADDILVYIEKVQQEEQLQWEEEEGGQSVYWGPLIIYYLNKCLLQRLCRDCIKRKSCLI